MRQNSYTSWKLVGLIVALFTVPLSRSQAEPIAMEFDTFKSSLIAVTGRSGMLSFLGHEHAVWAPRWTGALSYNFDHLRASTVELAIPTASIEVDSADARRRAGMSTSGPSEKDLAEIRRKFASPEVLDVAQFREIRFRSTSLENVEGRKSEAVLKGSLTLHGSTREVSVPIRISGADNGTMHFTGSFRVKLSDFGIKPPSAGAGMVNVADEIEFRMDLYTKPQTVTA